MDLKALFQPKTLAVVGVSLTHERHPANVVFTKNRLRQQVEVFPVNDRGGTFQGETVYRSISEIPRKIELAVIATRADLVPAIMTDCVASGVRGAVVISGGFAETGTLERIQALLRGGAIDVELGKRLLQGGLEIFRLKALLEVRENTGMGDGAWLLPDSLSPADESAFREALEAITNLQKVIHSSLAEQV